MGINLDRILASQIEDEAKPSDQEGLYMLGVRQDAAGSPVSADGDFHPFVFNNDGELKVVADISDASSKAEDATHTTGDQGKYVLAVRADTRPTNSNTDADGDYASFFINDSGEQYVIDTDGNALLTTIDADTGAIATSTANIDASLSAVADDAADTGDPIKIGSRSVTGALTALSANDDRADLLSDDHRRIWVNSSANVSISNAAETVGVVAAAIPTTPLTGRRKIIIQNKGSKSIFVGAAGVTTATGVEIGRNSSMELEVGDDIVMNAISETAGQNVRVLQTA